MTRLWLGLALIAVSSCIPSVGPTNPYDPATPVEQQARATASGVVYDYLGVPLKSAVVKLSGPTVPVNSPYTTDETGEFNFGELIPGTYTLDVKHPNHLRQIRDLLFTSGEFRAIDVELEAVPSVLTGETGHITGVIQKAGELSLPSAAQDHSGITVEVTGVGTRTTTNASGQFDIYLSPGKYSLGLSATNYKSESVADLVVANGETTTASATPIVLLANPGSIAGVVTLEGASLLTNSGITVSLDNTASTATTSDSGAFVIDGVAAGSYTLRASRTGFDTVVTTGVTVRGGVQTSVSDISLAIARGGLSGSVTLQGSSGGDNSGAVISIASTSYAAVSTSSGSFELTGVPAGTYSVSVSKENYATVVLSNQVVTANQITATSPATVTLVRQNGSFALEGGSAYTNLTGLAQGAVTKRRARISLLEAPNGSTLMKLSGDVHSWKVGSNYYAPSALTSVSDGIPLVLSNTQSTWLDVFLNGDIADPLDDGSKTVTVTFSDGATDTASFSAAIIADITAPVVSASSLLLDGDAAYTADDLVTASLAATDATSGIASYRLWNGASGAEPTTGPTSSPVAIVAAASQDLDPMSSIPADGDYNVSVRFYDQAGNASAVTTKAIRLDQTAPMGSAVITCPSGGPTPQTGYCWTSSVSLNLSAFSDAAPSSTLAQLQIINGTSFGFDSFTPFETPASHTLSPGDGLKTVSLKVKDGAGNTATLTGAATITVDATPPQSIAVTLTGTDKSGASTTLSSDRCVAISISATESNPYQLRVSNTPDFSGATAYSVMSFPNTPVFTGPELGGCSGGKFQIPVPPNTDQTRTVYVEITDRAGNKSVGFGSIEIDRQFPVLASAAFSSSFTTTTAATLLVTAFGTTEIRVTGANGASTVASPLGFGSYSVTSVPIVFGNSAVGQKSVDISVRDEAGNVTNSTASVSIGLDSTAPSTPVVVFVNGKVPDSTCSTTDEDDFHRTQVPLVNFTSTDSESQVAFYRMSESSLFSDASWQVYSGPAVPVPFTLSTGDGNKTIYIETQNGAGVSSSSASICIILDTTPPASLSLTATGNDARGYTSDNNVTFTLDGYDDGVGGTTGLKYFVDAVNSVCANATAPTAWQTSFTQVFTTGAGCVTDGTRRLAVRAVDPAGNVSDPVVSTLTKDSIAPSVPSIAYVKSLNSALEVSFTGSSAPGQNIEKYRIHFATTSVTGPSGHSGTVDLDPSTTLTVITGQDNDGSGLRNFNDYAVQIEAIDKANQSSGLSSPRPVAVGWALREIATATDGVIEPQQILYRDGKIYVLYNESSTATRAAGGGGVVSIPQARTRLVVSEDGGDSWRGSIVAEGATDPAPGRVNASMSISGRGINVITSVYDSGTDKSALVELASLDDGRSWSQDPKPIVAALEGPFPPNAIGDPNLQIFSVAGTSSSRTLVFAKKLGPGGVVDPFSTTRSDDTPGVVGQTGPTGPWSDPIALPIGGTDHGILRIAACNANMIDTVTWTPIATGTPNLQRVVTSSYHGQAWASPVLFNALDYAPSLAPMERIQSNALACSPLGTLTWTYLFATTENGKIYVSARTDDNAFAGAGIGALAPTGARQIATSSGGNVVADPTSPPSAWAGESNLFVAFRQAGTAALAVAVGNHNLSGVSGPIGRVALDWRINIVDDNLDAGKNPVIDGYINSSPVIAYTNTAGSSLKLARAASLLPQATPSLLEGSLGATGSSAYRWSKAPNANAYEVSTQSACAGPSTTFGSTNTQYTIGSGDTCVSVKSVDLNGLISDRGEKWRLKGFEPPTEVVSSFNGEDSSRNNGLVVVGNAIAILTRDRRIIASVDGGANFTQVLVVPGVLNIDAVALAGSSDGSKAYFHLVYKEKSGMNSSISYVRGEKSDPSVKGGAWTISTPYNMTPLVLASESVGTSELSPIINQQLAIKATGGRISTAFVLQELAQTTVQVRESNDHGASFGALIAGFENMQVNELDLAHSAGALSVFVRNVTAGPAFPVLHQAKVTSGFFSFGRICTPGPDEGANDFCGYSIARFATAANAQFLSLVTVDSSSSTTQPPALRFAAGARNAHDIADPAQREQGWRMGRFPSVHSTTNRESMDIASSDGANPGVWLVDSTCRTSVFGDRWDLNLRFCERSCQAVENWSSHIVQSYQSSCLSADVFEGLRISADVDNSKLYILYTGPGPIGTAQAQYLLRGGFIARQP